MVNTAPGFTRTPAVINGFSDLILNLWGPDAGPHARSAIGVAELPFNIPLEIEAEVAVDCGLGLKSKFLHPERTRLAPHRSPLPLHRGPLLPQCPKVG